MKLFAPRALAAAKVQSLLFHSLCACNENMISLLLLLGFCRRSDSLIRWVLLPLCTLISPKSIYHHMHSKSWLKSSSWSWWSIWHRFYKGEIDRYDSIIHLQAKAWHEFLKWIWTKQRVVMLWRFAETRINLLHVHFIAAVSSHGFHSSKTARVV